MKIIGIIVIGLLLGIMILIYACAKVSSRCRDEEEYEEMKQRLKNKH